MFEVGFKKIEMKVVETVYGDFIFEDVMQFLNIFKHGPVYIDYGTVKYYRLNAEFIKWMLEEKIVVITKNYHSSDLFKPGKNYKLAYDQLTLDQRIMNKLIGE